MSETATTTVTPAAAAATVPVILKTRTGYVIPTEKYMIPTSWRRFHLSQLINKVLALPQPVPFDFVVHGEMLRASLGEWCASKGIEEEETLEIEYIESVLPPERVSSIPHPDWVSSISCHLKGYFLTGSYDSCVRLYNDRQELLHTISSHSAPVSSVCFIPRPQAGPSDPQLIASTSYDTTCHIVSAPMDAMIVADDEERSRLKALASLQLHTAPISSVASNSTGSTLLTAGWDSYIGVWTTEIPESDEVDEVVYPSFDADRRKRRKVKKDENAPVRKAPQSVMKSHTSRISSIQWSPVSSDASLAYSCGWDFTARSWDVEAGVCTATMTASEKAMLDVAVTCNGRTLVSANGDRTASVFAIGSSASPSHLSHMSPVTSITAHPISAHHVASGCMDGIVRIWDLRSTKSAVESFVARGDQNEPAKEGQKQSASKVLSLDWSQGNLIGCAGEKGIDIFRILMSRRNTTTTASQRDQSVAPSARAGSLPPTQDDEDEECSFDLVDELQQHGINAQDISKLKSASVYTMHGVKAMSRRNMCKIKGLSEAKVEKIKEAAAKILGSSFLPATLVMEKRKDVFFISTGSKVVDGVLGGGIQSRCISEVYGEYRTGKTQLAHTICVVAQLPREMGGAGGKVAYIDTEGTFRPERISQIADRFGVEGAQVLENIVHARALNSEHQMELTKDLGERLAEGGYRLVIVDSIMALFRVDYSGRGELSERQQKLGQFLAHLTRMAEEYNLAILLTNQVQSDPGATMVFTAGGALKPIGGHVLSHASTVRMMLRKGRGDERIAKLSDSPDRPEGEATYKLAEGGWEDV
ncbi:Meiotic recombination protein dmc1 [Tulasnella sp. 331]|nr:Meiotic recombination protein dmc1 [Tulasnella sp. 331]